MDSRLKMSGMTEGGLKTSGMTEGALGMTGGVGNDGEGLTMSGMTEAGACGRAYLFCHSRSF